MCNVDVECTVFYVVFHDQTGCIMCGDYAVSVLQQMTAAAVAREKAKLYAEFGRGGGEEGGLADDLAPEVFLELEELRKK